jgi:hypothetical protein
VAGVLAAALVIGLGISTVYRAGPYPVRAANSGLQKVSRWENRLGFSVDPSGGRIWGSKAHRCDLTVDTAAGRAVLDRTDIYQAHNIRGWYYIYPPLFAIVMIPFTWMSTFWASLSWYLISVALVAETVKMCAGIVRPTTGWRRDSLLLCALPPLLALVPLMSALARGQTTPVLLWLTTAAVFCHWRDRDLLGGLSLAGAILLKVFPAALLAYFLWRRHWRFVLATVAGVLLGVFVIPSAAYGWRQNLCYLGEWKETVAKPALDTDVDSQDDRLYGQLHDPRLSRNQSLAAVLTRLTGNERARLAADAVGLAMAAAILFVGLHRSTTKEVFILSAVIAWMLLIPPVSWSHYFMLLLLPLTVLTGVAFADRDAGGRFVARAALIVFAVLALGVASRRSAQAYGPLCWGTLGLWAALVFVMWRVSWVSSASNPTARVAAGER